MSAKPKPYVRPVHVDPHQPAPRQPVIVPRVPPKPAPSPLGGGLTPANQSIYTTMSATLKAWGLSTLVPYLKGYLTQGMNANEIQMNLQNTDAWKTRFAGNVLREEKGMAVLTPAQYIATEQAYRQALSQYGLPSGFYDQHSDFVNWIGNDVSPSEISARAQVAHDQYMAAPQEVKDLWQKYGYAKGDALAAILDPKVATQVIQDRAIQVGIGGAAARQGFSVNKNRAVQLQQAGVTIQQAQAAYAKIAQSYAADQTIANRFGTTFGLQDEENDVLLNNGQDANKRAILYAEEQGLFNGRAPADSNTAGVSQSY